MSQEDRIKRLEEQLEKHERTISTMQKQIELLRQELYPEVPAPTVARPASPKPPTPGQTINAQSQPAPVPQTPARETLPPPEPIDWEHLIGRVWLPRIFILVLLIGVLWGFKAAVSAGYLTEPVRCVLGVVASAVLFFLGERQIRGKREALGQVLLGGAVSLLVLTTFAAHVLYGLIGTTPAFAFNVVSIAGGVYLAYRHRSEALGVLATVGGFLVPFLVESSDPSTIFFISYEILASLAFLLFASRQGYEILHYVASALFHLTAFFYVVQVHDADKYVLAYGVLAHHLILLGLALFKLSVTGKRKSYMTIYTSAVLTVFWWFALLYESDPEFYKGFLLAMTVVYAGLALWRRADRLQLSVFSSTSFFILMLYLFNLLEGNYESMALLLEGTLTLWLAYYLHSRLQMVTGWVIWGIGVVAILLEPIRVIASLETLAWVLLLGSVVALYDRLNRNSKEATDPDEITVKSTFVRLFGAGFAVLFLAFLTMVTDVLAEPLSLEGEYMAVSGVWALYAIVVIVFGTIKKSQFIRLSGVILLFVTLLKLIFVDLPSVSIVVRAILFITLGAIGVGISRLFYQKKG